VSVSRPSLRLTIVSIVPLLLAVVAEGGEEEITRLPWRGQSVAGPLLEVPRCRCAALLVLVLMSTLAMPNCGAQGAPTV
jgi:hypothetical protein